MEAWSKTKLEPTFVYGIRDYKKGAVLIPHRDRNETHIISAIINIDINLGNSVSPPSMTSLRYIMNV